ARAAAAAVDRAPSAPRLEIIKRLAHPHHDHVGYEPAALARRPRAVRGLRAGPVAKPVARQQHLADDLAGREIAHQALRPGVAEGAIERAADLARDAQRAAVRFRDIDALDLVGVFPGVLAGESQQPFARAVDRSLLGGDLRALEREMRIERSAQLLGDARHGVKTLRAAHVEPMPDL